MVHKAELERCPEQYEVRPRTCRAVGLAEARPLHENEGAAFTMGLCERPVRHGGDFSVVDCKRSDACHLADPDEPGRAR